MHLVLYLFYWASKEIKLCCSFNPQEKKVNKTPKISQKIFKSKLDPNYVFILCLVLWFGKRKKGILASPPPWLSHTNFSYISSLNLGLWFVNFHLLHLIFFFGFVFDNIYILTDNHNTTQHLSNWLRDGDSDFNPGDFDGPF